VAQLLSGRLNRFEDAALAFTACTTLAPDIAGCFYNRALAFVGADRTDRALRDFDRALKLDPGFAEAALNRGLLHFRAQRLGRAATDLQRALDLGAPAARAHFNLALVCLAQKDRAGAISHCEQSLRFDPAHKEAGELLKKLQQPR
jgi:tetratricopeptide (TPR) repeat protein